LRQSDLRPQPDEPDHRPIFPPETSLPGSSWLPLARGESVPARDFAFSEYHAFFLRHDWFLVAHGRWKYTWYSNGAAPTLFDLQTDPREMHDLSGDPHRAGVLRACRERLFSVCDPEVESRRAKQLQGLIGPNGEDYTEPGGGNSA
jgi:choline-sulfatase